MLEAFEGSYRFLTTWAAGCGLVLATIALILPAWQLLTGLLAATLRLATRVPPRGAGSAGPFAGREGTGDLEQLRPVVGAAMGRLLGETRALLGELAHQGGRAHRWRDRPRRGWAWVFGGQRGDEYTAATELRAMVWDWLSRAEALLEGEAELAEAQREALELCSAQVRRLVFGDVDLAERLDAIVAVIAGFEGGLRGLEHTPYRGRAPLRPAGAVSGRDPARDEESPRGDAASSELDALLVLREHEPAFRRIAARYADDAAAREDLAQEIRMAVWVALPRHRGDASVKTYVLRIAYYCAARFGRRQFKPLGELDVEALVDLEAGDALACLHRRECREGLHRAIAQLPDSQRIALELLMDGCSYREIGERLGITETNASVRVSRARARLKKSLVPVFN